MPSIKSHPPGNFCWFELSTSDWRAAKTFYTSLFGWGTNEIPMEPGQPPYVLLEKDGADVGALYQGDPKQGPPNWMTYVAVASVDEAANKAATLGATVVAAPFDVFDFGRMAVIRDPQGGFFSLYQEKKYRRDMRVGDSGSACWSELHTTDTAGAKRFYTSLFGWMTKDSPDYIELANGGQPIGGIMEKRAVDAPPFWLTYFAVDDCDASAAKAKSLGGQVHVEPTDIPNVGRFAVVMDPQGAAFAVIKLSY